MAKPQKQQPSFTSFRVIGKKAQEILEKAKKLRTNSGGNGSVSLPAAKLAPQVHVSVDQWSVVRGALWVLVIVSGVTLALNLTEPIMLLVLGFFVAAVIDPGVRMMERWGLPRGIGVLAQYLIALLVFLFLVLSLAPIIASQLGQIADMMSEHVNAFLLDPRIDLPLVTAELNLRLTEFTQSMLQSLSIHKFTDALQQFGDNISAFARGSITFAAQVASGVVSFVVKLIVVLVLGFFIQMEKEQLRSWFCSFFGHRYRSYLDNKIEAIQHKLGQWARGQLILGCAIGTLVFIALTILGMDYAVTLAVLAAFTEFIPYIGPIIAAVPAILIALTQEGVLWMLIVMGVYYVIQWCENNLLVPLIMKRAVGLSPIAIITAMLIGVSFPSVMHPVLGILLAVPTTTIITLFIEDWRISQSRKP